CGYCIVPHNMIHHIQHHIQSDATSRAQHHTYLTQNTSHRIPHTEYLPQHHTQTPHTQHDNKIGAAHQT
ncbi:MAG: hypothetical protein OXC46_09445, partial [Thaumarchaeota archaeon]|nr:hypothetical protein [Nitrososphaerota archaeon]